MLTITEPTDTYLSRYTKFNFSGTYENIDSIKIKIGDNEFNTMDVLANGKWQVEVDLSQINAKKDIDVVVYGYKNDKLSTAIIKTDPIKITVHNWRDPATSEDLYSYFSDSDSYLFSGMVCKGGYLYLTGEKDGAPPKALVFKIQDSGSSFGALQITTDEPTSSQGSRGYDIAIANNDDIYIAVKYYNSVWTTKRFLPIV